MKNFLISEVINGIKWYFIELPKFRKMNPDINQKLNQWLFLLDDYDEEAICMAEKKNPSIKKARKEVTYLTGVEAVKRMEFLHEKWEMDRISDINYAKRETARKLLEQNVDIEIVIKATGLSKEEIKEIIAEKDNSN